MGFRGNERAAILEALHCNKPRATLAADIADLIRSIGPYHWTGLHDVDLRSGLVPNIAWSGPSRPEFPVFPVTKGLTSRAIATKLAVNVGCVSGHPDYLTALANTQPEIIVPILSDGQVVGTLDIESEACHAFDPETQVQIVQYSSLITDLWEAVRIKFLPNHLASGNRGFTRHGAQHSTEHSQLPAEDR